MLWEFCGLIHAEPCEAPCTLLHCQPPSGTPGGPDTPAMSTLPPGPWLSLRPEVAERLSRRVEERIERQEAMWRMKQCHVELSAAIR